MTEPAARPSALSPESMAIVVIDIQDKLARIMDPAACEKVEKNVRNLLELARLHGIRVLATEQYPKGLGPTVGALAGRLDELDVERHAKLDFSSAGCPAFMEALRGADVKTLVLTGMEAHICVLMTALDLVADGYEVIVPHDAVISRLPGNRETALQQLREAGVRVTSTETILFRVLGRSGTDEFKAISKMLKDT